VPSVVVNVIDVPLCGGVPDDSMTCAMSVDEPFIGRAVAPETSVIVEPVGASSGTFSQAAETAARANAQAGSVNDRRRRVNMRTLNILIP